MTVAVSAPAAVCDCPACEAGLEPFTLPHFRVWALGLTLDTGDPWDVEDFAGDFLEDVFAMHGRPGVLWLVIPEGNTKTTTTGGLGLYYLEHFPNPAIPVAAAAKEQADTLYSQAEGFVLRSERLTELKPDLVGAAKGKFAEAGRRHEKEWKKLVPRFEAQEGWRRIKFYKGGRLQIRAADDRTGDGIIPRGIMIIDELHRHRSLSLYRTWLGKAEKANALLIVISTAGEPGGEFEAEREDIRRSAEHVERTETFGRYVSAERVLHDWALPEDGDPENFELVARANPFSAITAETLERKFKRLGKAGGTLQHWRRLTCNLPTRSDMSAIQEAEWFAAKAKAKDQIPLGEPIWLGLDVAWKWDDTAASPYWWRDEHHRRLGPLRSLTPPRDGSSLDPAKVEAMLVEIHEANPVHTVVMDMARAEQLAAWIEAELGATVIDWPQSIPVKVRDFERFMEALRQGWLKHAGDEAMTRHALNAVARVLPKGDAVFERPAQSRTSSEQARRVIDGLIAAAMVNNAAVSTVGATYEGPAIEVFG